MLKKVIEWCEHHRNDPVQPADDDADTRKKTTDIEEWDQKFMQVDQEMLFEVILVSCRLSPLGSAIASYLTPSTGRELPRHQAPARRRMQDSGQHDQGKVPRGDPQDF